MGEMTELVPRRIHAGGRRRIHISNAARQQRYRARLARKAGRALNRKVSYPKPGIQPPTAEPPVLPLRGAFTTDESYGQAITRYQVKLKDFEELWAEYLRKTGESMARGMALVDAPRGKGELICGGYGPDKVSQVYAAGLFAALDEENGYHARPVNPGGAGPSFDGDEPGDMECW